MQKKIGVIGGGVSGITAAYLLSKKHTITIFEKNNYVGGHTNTIEITDGPDAGTAVDTGFIVLNDRTYPNFHALLKALDTPWRYADMSFSVWCKETNLQYGSKNLSTIFAQRKNIFSPSFWSLLKEIKRFWAVSKEALEKNNLGNQTLEEFLEATKLNINFRENFLLPLGAAIWSTPSNKIGEFPAQTFLTFFKNHGYLHYADQPKWQTVVGGSFAYVKAFKKVFNGKMVTNATVVAIQKSTDNKQIVTLADGSREIFDELIIASHADEARMLIQDPSLEETQALAPWQYNKNRTLLHTDVSFMPPNKAAWASWNYSKELTSKDTLEAPVSITYDMNCLQGLKTKNNYFVTLNPLFEPKNILREFHYTHPIYLPSSVAAQKTMQSINGSNGRYFVGAYLGYGFHEDGVKSALAVTEKFGISNFE